MLKIRLKKTFILISILFVQPVISPDSFAFAKRRSPPKAYSFIAEGGKASQGECDGERKIPRRLKRQKEYAKTDSYMGSELQESELKGKIDGEMWKHFFRAKATCNAVLAKTPSAIEETQKNSKGELPPDDADDSDADPESDAESEPNAGPSESASEE